ncbi:hypothetical protein AGMMS49992_26870 [Clostridia bacterium]|nr:hypothetical protein AGMMS49992_26870 [Clostridia bacterium]
MLDLLWRIIGNAWSWISAICILLITLAVVAVIITSVITVTKQKILRLIKGEQRRE